jgi:hypothetical protein
VITIATFTEMLDSGFFLIIGTVTLIVITFTCGPIMDWLAIWLPSQPAGRIPIAPVQLVFGTFYGMICLIEVGLFVQFFLTTIKRTDYNTGEDNW